MKKPTADERRHACGRKRRYRSQGDALDAALLAGVERERTAYRCPHCGHWHLASQRRS
jgi:DNA-directed RNA polymerase subunit RPC12/RpoP